MGQSPACFIDRRIQIPAALGGEYKIQIPWKAPYPPVDLDATLANYPAIVRDYSTLGQDRLDPFH